MEEIRDCYEANLQSIQLEESCIINLGLLGKFEDILLHYFLELFVVVFYIDINLRRKFLPKN